jgi:hypothetical protein
MALVQIGRPAEKFPIAMDTLAIEQDRIPDGRKVAIRVGVIDRIAALAHPQSIRIF